MITGKFKNLSVFLFTGCFMKKFLCFSLAILILNISILVYCPLGVFASYPDDYYSLPKPYTDAMSLSSSDAQAAVNSRKDIADSNGILCFQYTPTDTYNWTMNTKNQKIHLSDNQLKNLLMSKHSLSHGFLEFIYGASNSNAYRGFISSVGLATKTDSDTLLSISDKITGNYNYLNAIDYNEDSQTITMSNDNGSVDKLREEIKQYYYDSIGLRRSKSNDTTKNPGAVISSLHTFYEYEEDYTSDFMACNQYDYATCSYMNYSYSVYFAVAFDKSSYSYAYIDNSSNLYFTDKDLSILDDDSVVHVFLNHYKNSSTGIEYDLTFSKMSVINGLSAKFLYSSGSVVSSGYINQNNRFYSQKGIDFVYFSSFEKLYNFVHGSQTAYLSSRIDKAGEDISYSIKDMNENLGTKMDELIDSINSGKGNMSADELQNAIDKGLEDLNKNTEDIKDNTNDILEVLKEQNQILLDILGVTKHIADTVDDIDDNANFSSLMSLLSTVFLGIQNAILYGQNTMDSDDNTDTQAITYDESGIAVYSSGGGTSLDYRGGIFGHFPFSVIYHLYDWLKVLQTEPKCPEFSYNYGFMIGRKDDTECQITFDLSQYESWRDVISSFMKLSFTLAVAVGIYKKFKGGDLS